MQPANRYVFQRNSCERLDPTVVPCWTPCISELMAESKILLLEQQQLTRVTIKLTAPESDVVYRPTCILHQLGNTGYMVAHLAAMYSWREKRFSCSESSSTTASATNQPRRRAMMSASRHTYCTTAELGDTGYYYLIALAFMAYGQEQYLSCSQSKSTHASEII